MWLVGISHLEEDYVFQRCLIVFCQGKDLTLSFLWSRWLVLDIELVWLSTASMLQRLSNVRPTLMRRRLHWLGFLTFVAASSQSLFFVHFVCRYVVSFKPFHRVWCFKDSLMVILQRASYALSKLCLNASSDVDVKIWSGWVMEFATDFWNLVFCTCINDAAVGFHSLWFPEDQESSL